TKIEPTDAKTPVTRRAATDASPDDDYEDRKAFRERIRADLAAVSLDDLHDADGNGLYRLQLRATLLPGHDKDKFGVARLTVRPPQLNDGEIGRLYNTWLWHVASRLNLRNLDKSAEVVAQVSRGISKDYEATNDVLYDALAVLGLYKTQKLS